MIPRFSTPSPKGRPDAHRVHRGDVLFAAPLQHSPQPTAAKPCYI